MKRLDQNRNEVVANLQYNAPEMSMIIAAHRVIRMVMIDHDQNHHRQDFGLEVHHDQEVRLR